jgi:hypothetical protein
VVQQEGKPEAERKFADRRDHRVEDGELDSDPKHPVLEQRDVVLPADEEARAADAGVGEAEPHAEPERIGEEDDQQPGGRQHEQEDQEPAVVEQPQKPVLLGPDLGPLRRCRHCHPPAGAS